MAGRVAKTTVDWAQFAKRVRPQNLGSYRAFKQINDKYVARVQSLPEELPKIDFEFYKKNVDDAAWVDKMKAEYEKVKVSYPKDPDNQVEQIAQEAATAEEDKKVRMAELHSAVAKHKALIEAIATLPPVEDMTRQMYRHYFPEKNPNPYNPRFWPHTPLDDPNILRNVLGMRFISRKSDVPKIMYYRVYREDQPQAQASH